MRTDPLAALRAQADRLEAYGGPLAPEAAALRATLQDLEQAPGSDPTAGAQLRTERDQERARLAAVLEHLPIGLILVDAATMAITHYNVQAAHLLGHALRPTRTLADFATYHGVHPDGRPYAPHEYPLAQALAGQIVHAAPVWYQVDETQRRLLHVTAAPIADGTGAITMAVAIFVDMTDHDQAVQERLRLLAQAQAAQEQAEAERTHLYRLLEQAPAAICLVQGPDYRYTLANTTYCQLLGRPRANVEGALVRDVFPEYVEQGILDQLDGVWTTGQPYYGHEERVQVVRPIDEVLEDRYFTFVYAPISDGAGTITHIGSPAMIVQADAPISGILA